MTHHTGPDVILGMVAMGVSILSFLTVYTDIRAWVKRNADIALRKPEA
ncbi:hypothetical protein KGP36_07475 [Patescibacteria group bacterium]|nr:hypothetical protein [Patescibacteria group bacterium]